MNKIKILVTAANGHTGFPAAKELINLGFNVRAMVRNEKNPNAQELKRLGAEIFIGDMDDFRDFQRALSGVQRAYFCSPFGRNTLFQTIAFIIAAEEAKIEHVVYMSQWLLSQYHPSINTKMQWLGEQIVKMHKNVKYTFVNPGMFAFTYFFTVESMAQLGMMPTAVKGEGLNAPPSEEDQGRVIAHILKDPSQHHGKTYRPTGPKIISQSEVASIFAKIFKRKVKIMEVSEKMLLKSLKAGKYPIYEYSNIRYYLKDVEKNVFAIGGTTNVVKELTGKDPEDFETIARRYIAQMPEAKQTFSNKLKAIKNFIKILLTKAPDMNAFEKQQYYPNFINGMNQAAENKEWLSMRKTESYNFTTIKNLSILKYMIVSILFFGCAQNMRKEKQVSIDNGLTQEIESYVKGQEKLGFKGTIYISKEDTVLYKSSIGGNNYALDRAFYVASISKQFTAAGIMKLYENKQISLNDSLSLFFNEVPLDKRKITIHHLLTHTSGLPNNYIADGILERQNAIGNILSEPLEYEVGNTFNYSAEGYNLLAIIIEIVTGKSYEDYLRKNMFEPNGLYNTGFWGKEDKHLGFAPFNDIEILNKLPKNVFNQGTTIANYGYKGGTGIYSTIEDLYQWTRLLNSNKYLSKENTQLLFSTYSNVRGDSINGTFYGYGWLVQLTDGIITEIRHGGSEDGLHNGIVRWNNNGHIIIVLSNQWADNVKGGLNGVEWSTVLSIGLRDILKKRK